ncbi:MAG TPA: hypothetical protein PLL69_02490 [Gemmatimonadales bacterium]|nr:hypothetical protein [Gemmatimonadales bacterium]
MKPFRVAMAAGLTAVILVALHAMSALPVGWHDEGEAMLRLSWRARPERLEHCRAPSPEELEQMAEHMRQRLICEGITASYDLRVTVDDRVIDSRVVRGGGLRHDRPLQLLREYRVPSEASRIKVTFSRRESATSPGETSMTIERGADSGTFAGRAQREASERDRSRQAAIPPDLGLDTVLAIPAGTVALITFDTEKRALRLVTRNAP